MAVRDIIYLKSRYENGDTPDQWDFGDLLDTMFAHAPSSSPLIVSFNGLIIVDPNEPPNNLDFEVDISIDPSFSPLLVQARTLVSTSNWEYWNGVTMVGLPSDGLHPSYQNQDVGLVTYTWNDAARGVSYYVRYRSGFLGVWGDYRVMKITV